MPGGTLRFVLGDQLDRNGPSIRDLGDNDIVVLAEVADEASRIRNHKVRIALFFSAMRHFRDDLTGRGVQVDYHEFDPEGPASLPQALAEAIRRHAPSSVIIARPGRHDLIESLREVCQEHDVAFEPREDDHFLVTPAEFREWAAERKTMVLEHFYRRLRKQTGILMDGRDPAGGDWNYDSKNRASFKADGPGETPDPRLPEPDAITREVIELVEREFSDAPGSLEHFRWPVTPSQAEAVLDRFIESRLPSFGTHQDAMWTDRPFLYHSMLSSSLNLRLLNPRDVAARAEQAYREGRAPINAVEGFVRQVIGWREFIRGIYWLEMPGYKDLNALGADQNLPPLYWTGETEMACLSDVVGQLLDHAYAHHIQRLMVAGLFAQLLGVRPLQIHDWFMAFFVDSVEWVTLPNVTGMSQFADGGVVGTKPYVATGKYVNRMSNYCKGCAYDPDESTGDKACPFTTLYWDFLDRHRDQLEGNRRMNFQMRNLDRKSRETVEAIREKATTIRREVQKGNV